MTVVVVGAGPTGLTAAILLARRGVEVVVLEQRDAPLRQPRAVHLDDESVRVLQAAGLSEAFAAFSRPATGLRLLDARLRPFAVFRRPVTPGPHGHPAANLFDQPDLDALLLDAAAALGVEVRTGVAVSGVRPRPDGTVAVLGDLPLSAAAVLGCDGATSTVRAGLGIEMRDLGLTQRWLVVDVRGGGGVCGRGRGDDGCGQGGDGGGPAAVDDWGGVDQVCDPRRAATHMRLTGERHRFEFRLHPGETAAELGAQLERLLAPWLGTGRHDVVRCAEYTFRARIARRWQDGRVFLLGDAAHQMPPFVGQGLGAGLRDAHNLAWKLAAALRGDEDHLASYGPERAPHAEAVVRTSVRVGLAMTGGNGVVAALRRPVVAGLLRLPGAERRALAATVARYPPGPSVAVRAHRHDLAGTLCPQPAVEQDGRTALLDEVLGPDWALVSTGPVPAGLAAAARTRGARPVRLAEDVRDDGTLAAWLRAGRTTAALLRPDRVVAATR